LVVAHQTASSPELVERVTALAGADPSAEFVLLVPATATQHLLGWMEGEAMEVAGRGAGEYDGVIICTLPLGVSRWLRLDLPHRAERKFSLPVIHVVAAPTAAADISSRVGFDTMLVALNVCPSEAILEPITFLAKRLTSHVSLVHVLEEAEDEAEAERYLDRVANGLHEEGVAANTVLLGGEPAKAIVDFARGGNYGLVAMATCGGGGDARSALGDVTAEVLRGWPRPLLLARPRFDDPGATSGDVSRIVVPLDGSGAAEEALPHAEELARRLGLPVTLIEAITVSCQPAAAVPLAATGGTRPGLGGGESLPDHPLEMESRLDVTATSYLSDICQRLTDKGIDATWQAPWGAALDAILEQIRHGDGALVVMSARGSSGHRGASLGSVARAVIRAAPTPVLTVPAKGGPS
jgi:nucleotide-binding universal stress UspA family protein